MKILHIGNIKSGIDTYVRNTISMSSDDFEFVVVCGADDKCVPFLKNGKEVKTYTIPMYRALNPFRDFMSVWKAVKIIKKEKPDIVHCHSAKGGVIGRIAGFLTKRKTLYTAHAFSFLSAESSLKQKIFLFLEKVTKFKSILLGCSQSERELGINRVGYSENRALAWNNAIPTISESDIKEPDDEIKKQRYIISIGRPSYQKNPLLMVEIMRIVHEKHPDVKFYLLGVGFYSPMLDEMKALITKYNLTDIIILLPWLSHQETLGYLKYAEMYLTTSVYEGLPIAVLEALAMKKAVVSSDTIGNNDCVKDNYNGFLLPMDAKQFADKITILLENEEIRRQMEANSYSYFESNFNIANRIGELENIYKQIIK